MRIALAPRWHRRAVKLSLLSRNVVHMGAGPQVLQCFRSRRPQAAFSTAASILFRHWSDFSSPRAEEPEFRKRIGLAVEAGHPPEPRFGDRYHVRLGCH